MRSVGSHLSLCMVQLLHTAATKTEFYELLPSKGICWIHSPHNSCLRMENGLISAGT